MVNASITKDTILARDISFESYMANYAQHHSEWVEGMVIQLSPVSREHDLLSGFLYRLLSGYLDETGEGLLMKEPFVMRATPDSPGREPDLHIVHRDRADIVKDTLTEGAADIVIEIVSKESSVRDRGEKFDEYEIGGVREYWLIDPLRREARFYHLDETGSYRPIELQVGMFHSTILPRFRLDVNILWLTPLPDRKQINTMIDTMLNKSNI